MIFFLNISLQIAKSETRGFSLEILEFKSVVLSFIKVEKEITFLVEILPFITGVNSLFFP